MRSNPLPFIEDVIKENRKMYGEYHPNQRTRDRSMVMVKGVGCVFIGSVEDCKQYIEENEWRYDEKKQLVATA